MVSFELSFLYIRLSAKSNVIVYIEVTIYFWYKETGIHACMQLKLLAIFNNSFRFIKINTSQTVGSSFIIHGSHSRLMFWPYNYNFVLWIQLFSPKLTLYIFIKVITVKPWTQITFPWKYIISHVLLAIGLCI